MNLMHYVWRGGRAVLAVALLMCSGACGPAAVPKETAKPLNLVIVVLDSLRADHLGCYGYSRSTSPFIDSLAAQGVTFTRAMAPSSYTRESVSALFTGLPPSLSPTGTGWFSIPDPERVNLGEAFTRAGYATAFLTDAPVFAMTPFAKGFTEGDRVPTAWGESGSGPELSKRALEFAEKHRAQPLCMYVHYLDPHTPYRPSDEYYRKFAPERHPQPLDVIEDVRPNVPALVESGFGPGDARFEDMMTSYDAEIAFNDQAVADLVRGLEGLGLLDSTLVIVTSDHGEEFLEHGFVEHAWTLYEESVHVPLIFWRPGMLEAARPEAAVSLYDIYPTVLRLLEIPNARADFFGGPLFVQENGAWTITAPARPIISELMLETRTLVRAVIQGPHKYLAAPKWLTPAECSDAAKTQKEGIAALREGTYPVTDIMGPPVREWLFDHAADPKETHDIAAESPEVLAALRATLETYLKACPPRAGRTEPTPAQEEMDPEREQQLRSQGYL
jgi:arylsulfatase